MRVYMSMCACVRKRLIVANLMLYIGAVVTMRSRRWKQGVGINAKSVFVPSIIC